MIYKGGRVTTPLEREEDEALSERMGNRLKPSERERKRYIAFEIISKNPINSLSKLQKAIAMSMVSQYGEMGLARSGMIVVPERYKDQKGVLRVTHKMVNPAIAAMTLTSKIDDEEVCIQTLGVSGMISKAFKKPKTIGG